MLAGFFLGSLTMLNILGVTRFIEHDEGNLVAAGTGADPSAVVE